MLEAMDQHIHLFPANPQDHEESGASVLDMYNGIRCAYLQRIQWCVHIRCEHVNYIHLESTDSGCYYKNMK